MAGTNNQVRPQWLKNAGPEGVAPWDVFEEDLVNKDLRGLTFARTRYYCSRNAKNTGQRGRDNNIPIFTGQHESRPGVFWGFKVEPRNRTIRHGFVREEGVLRRSDLGSAVVRPRPKKYDSYFDVFTRDQHNDRVPSGWNYCEEDGVFTPHMRNLDLSKSNLEGADLHSVDLSNINLGQ